MVALVHLTELVENEVETGGVVGAYRILKLGQAETVPLPPPARYRGSRKV
jgi:hypothetical protein